MNNTSTRELEAQRAVLLKQLRRAGPTLGGSLATVPRRCGSPNCHCMRGGPMHQAVILCKKVNGRSVAMHIPKALQEQARRWNEEHRKIKRIFREMSDINEQILRRYVGEQRQANRVRRSLKVAGGKTSAKKA